MLIWAPFPTATVQAARQKAAADPDQTFSRLIFSVPDNFQILKLWAFGVKERTFQMSP